MSARAGHAGRLSVTPPEGVNIRDFATTQSFGGVSGTGARLPAQFPGCGQALGSQVTPSIVRNFVCCIITGATAPSLGQSAWP